MKTRKQAKKEAEEYLEELLEKGLHPTLAEYKYGAEDKESSKFSVRYDVSNIEEALRTGQRSTTYRNFEYTTTEIKE